MTISHTGQWHRNGTKIVLDFPSFSPPPGDELFENEAPPPRAPLRPAPRLRLSLAEARKQLRAFLKDAKSLKANAKLGNPADNSPFVDAFQAALNKAKPLASAYVDALRTYTPPRIRTVDDARKELQLFLEDAEALKEWVDPNEPGLKSFFDAHTAARAQAKVAATKYAAITK